MELPERLTTALRSIHSALDALDAVVDRHLQAGNAHGELQGELSVMQEDRMRLAGELGRSLARNQALLAATSEVRERLDRVAGTVRSLVGGAGPDADGAAARDPAP